MDSLNKGTASDSNGIRAADIKTCNDTTREMIRQIFNEVIRQNDCTPEAWRRIRIRVIYKKGDVEEAGNYRPNCTLPALYKLFSTLLYSRLYSRLDREQPTDQGGFRRSYQTSDHLASYRLLEQRCRVWGVKVWIATVDFMKAFDTISHKSVWDALAQFGIEPQYISLLKRLYADQQATVLTDKESDVLEIKRGTKQGDPLSSLLFNTVLQAALKDDLTRWREKAWAYAWVIHRKIALQTCDSPTTYSCSQHRLSNCRE